MAHVHRFYVAPEDAGADEIALSVEEAHHALRVVRVQAGDPVVLFDGQGLEIDGTVRHVAHRDVVVAARERRYATKPRIRLTLVQAWLHRDKSVESLVQRGSELGVVHFRFFRADRSEHAPRLNPKWRRVAIEACKQSGRAWLPSFEAVSNLAASLEDLEGTLLVATKHLPPVPLREAAKGNDIALVVGPEGDFTPEELDIAERHGATPISLGSATYRSEVAAVAACTLIFYELGGLGPLGE